jgi:hypothetical protein
VWRDRWSFRTAKTRLGHPARWSISNSLECYGRCVELAETFYSRLLLWRSRNTKFEIECPYLGTDAGSRYACTIPKD